MRHAPACFAFLVVLPITLGFVPSAWAASEGIPCAPGYERSPLSLCTGNANGRAMLELVELGPPPPRPPIDATPSRPDGRLLKYVYARAARDEVMVYAHPADGLEGRPPVRSLGTGFVFVSEEARTTYAGQEFVQINPGEFVPAGDLTVVEPSGFHGVTFSEAPSVPFGWVIANFQLRRAPGAEAQSGDPWLPRYATFQVFGAQRVGDWMWYLVGPDQWIEQRSVAIASPTPPAAAPGRLIAVDTYEQTLVAYQDGRTAFATLISSGLSAESTPPGTYHVYARLNHGLMTGAYRRDASDYYYLEDVPFILYFDGDRAIHGAYWHDSFGSKRSHGCVNVSVSDAKWLLDWAPQGTPVIVFNSAPAH